MDHMLGLRRCSASASLTDPAVWAPPTRPCAGGRQAHQCRDRTAHSWRRVVHEFVTLHTLPAADGDPTVTVATSLGPWFHQVGQTLESERADNVCDGPKVSGLKRACVGQAPNLAWYTAMQIASRTRFLSSPLGRSGQVTCT